jgi:hypothetical protein
VAEAVIHLLEAVEIDEQQGQLLCASARLQEALGFALELDAIGERGDGIVHGHGLGIVDGRPDLLEQGVDGGGERGHLAADRYGGRRSEIAAADGEQAIDESGNGAGVGAIRLFGGDPDDQQREQADGEGGDDLLVDVADQHEGDEREQERCRPRTEGHQEIAESFDDVTHPLALAFPDPAGSPDPGMWKVAVAA